MPRIKEYQQQTNAPSGLSTAQMSPDMAGATGRAITGFGQVLGEVQERIHQKNVTIQTTESAATISELRAKKAIQIKEQADRGEVDDEGILKEYDDEIQALLNNVDTDEARNYILKSSAELRSSIQQNASAAKSELARVQVLEKHQSQNAADTQTLRLDPTQYESIKLQREAYYASLPMGAKQIEKLRHDDARNLNLARISGEIARTRDEFLPELADSIKTGKYNLESLSGDDIDSVLRDIRQESAAREGQKRLKEDSDKRERERLAEKEMDSFVKKAVVGNITSKDVSNFRFAGSSDKMRMISWMRSNKDEANKEEQARTYTELYRRLQKPDGDPQRIYSDEQLIKYLDPSNPSGSLSIEQFEKLRTELKGTKSQAGAHRNVLKENFLKQAEDLILKRDMATGAIDPSRYTVFNSFTEEFSNIYNDAKSQGIKDSELFDENNKANIYHLIQKYTKTSSELLRQTYKRPTMKDMEWVDENGNIVDVSPSGISPSESLKLKREGKIKLRKKQKVNK